jgi:hypothetical protein
MYVDSLMLTVNIMHGRGCFIGRFAQLFRLNLNYQHAVTMSPILIPSTLYIYRVTFAYYIALKDIRIDPLACEPPKETKDSAKTFLDKNGHNDMPRL